MADRNVGLRLSLDTREFNAQARKAGQTIQNIGTQASIQEQLQASREAERAIKLQYQQRAKAQKELNAEVQKTKTIMSQANRGTLTVKQENAFIDSNTKYTPDLFTKPIVSALASLRREQARQLQVSTSKDGGGFLSILNPFRQVGATLSGAVKGFREGIGQRLAARVADSYVANYEKRLGLSLDKLATRVSDISINIGGAIKEGVRQSGLLDESGRIANQFKLASRNVLGSNRTRQRVVRDENNKIVMEKDEKGRMRAKMRTEQVNTPGMMNRDATTFQNRVVAASIKDVVSTSIRALQGQEKASEQLGDSMGALNQAVVGYANVLRQGYQVFLQQQAKRVLPIAERKANRMVRDNRDQLQSYGAPIVNAVGGYAGEGGKSSGTVVKPAISESIGGNVKVNVIPNASLDKGTTPYTENGIIHTFNMFMGNIEDTIKGIGLDAVNLAATNIASRKVNPNAPIVGIGYSGGGGLQGKGTLVTNTYDDAQIEANKVNIKSVGIATPEGFGRSDSVPNHMTITSNLDHIYTGAKKLGLSDESNPYQGMSGTGVVGHDIKDYLKSDVVVPIINYFTGLEFGRTDGNKNNFVEGNTFELPVNNKQVLGGLSNAPRKKDLSNALLNTRGSDGEYLITKQGLQAIYTQATNGKKLDNSLTRDLIVKELSKLPKAEVVKAINSRGNEIKSQANKNPEYVSQATPKRTDNIKSATADVAAQYDEQKKLLAEIEDQKKKGLITDQYVYEAAKAIYVQMRANYNLLQNTLATTRDLTTEERLTLNNTSQKYKNTLERKGSKNPDGGRTKVTKLEADLAKYKKAAGDLGSDFNEGYALGIEGQDMSAQAAFKLGKDALEALRKAQDSHSPSKETIKLGKDHGEGFAIGINLMRDEVGKSASGLVDKAKRAIMKKSPELYQVLRHGSNYGGAIANPKALKQLNNFDFKGAKASSKEGLDAYVEAQYQRAIEIAKKRAARQRYRGNDTPEGVTFFSAGLAGQRGNSWGSQRDLNQMRGESYKAQMVDNKTTDIVDFAKDVVPRSLLNKFRVINADSIEMASKALVVVSKNSQAEITAIGHSYGSHVVDIFGGILKRMGVAAKTYGFGQPMGTLNPDTHTGVIAQNDMLRFTKFLGLKTKEVKGEPVKGDISGHTLPNYNNLIPKTSKTAKGEILTKSEMNEKLLHAVDLAQDTISRITFKTGEEYLMAIRKEIKNLMTKTRGELRAMSLDRYEGKDHKQATRRRSDNYNISLLEAVGLRPNLLPARDANRTFDPATKRAAAGGNGGNGGNKPPNKTSQQPEEPDKNRVEVGAKIIEEMRNAVQSLIQSLEAIHPVLGGIARGFLGIAKSFNSQNLIKGLNVVKSGLKVATEAVRAFDRQIVALHRSQAALTATQAAIGQTFTEAYRLGIAGVSAFGNAFALLDEKIASIDYGAAIKHIIQGGGVLQGTSRKLLQTALAFGAAFLAFKIVNPFLGFVRGAIEAKKEVDNLFVKMKSAGLAGSRDNFLSTQVSKANKSFTDVRSYTSLQASLQSTVGAKGGNAGKLTDDITAGLSARGIGGDEASRFLTGINQMAGKGVVSMEEMRQQLSEALPSAMSIAADSMGVTVAQFNQLVATGQLLTDDFLPKFAKQLKASSSGMVTSAQAGAMLSNEVLLLKDKLASILPIKQAFVLLIGVMKGLQAYIVPITVAMVALAGGGIAAAIMGIALLVKASAVAAAVLATLAVSAVYLGAALTAGVLIWNAYGFAVGRSAEKVRKIGKDLEKLRKDQDKARGNSKNNGEFDGYARVPKYVVTQRGKSRYARLDVQAIEENSKIINRDMVRYQGTAVKDSDEARIREQSKKIAALREQAAKGINLGLNPSEIKKVGEEADKLAKDLDLEIETKFKVSDKQETLLAAQQQLAEINSQIADGNPLTGALMMSKQEAEKTIANLKAELAKINKLKLIVSLVPELASKNLAERDSLAFRTTEAQLDGQMAMLKTAIEENTTAVGLEALTRKEAISQQKRQVVLNKAQIKSEQTVVNAITGAQAAEVKKVSGGTSLQDLDYKGLLALENTLKANAEANATQEDPNLAKAIEAQKQILELTQQNKQITVDIVRAELELKTAINDLKISMKGLEIEGVAKAVEIAKFKLSVDRFSEDKVRPLELSLSDAKFGNEGILRGMQEGFDSAVRGLKDFNFGLGEAIVDLKSRIRNISFELYTGKVGQVGTILQAQGIQDPYGMGQIRDLIVKAVGNRQNSQTTNLERDKVNSEKSFKLEVENKNRELESLKRDARAQYRDVSKQRDENRFNLKRANSDVPLEFADLQIQAKQLEMGIAAHNKAVDEANDSAKAYGQPERVSRYNGIVPEVNPEDFEGTMAKLNELFNELDANYAATLDGIQAIEDRGVSAFNTELGNARKLHDETMALKAQEIALSKAQDEQNQKNIINEANAIKLGILKNIGNEARNVQQQIVELDSSVKGLLNKPVSTAEFVARIRDAKAAEIDAKLEEMKAKKAELDLLINTGNYDQGGISGTKALITDTNSKLSQQEQSAFLATLNSIEQSGDYAKLKGLLEELSAAYSRNTNELESNKDAVIQAEVDKAKKENDRKQFDASAQLLRAKNNAGFKTDTNRSKVELKLDKQESDQGAIRQYNDTVASGGDAEAAAKLRDTLLQINQINYDEAMRKLTSFKEYLRTTVQKPLEDMFYGIGETIGKKVGNAVDPTELNNKMNEVNAQFGEQLLSLQEKYAEDPEGLRLATERLKELNDTKLDGLKNEFSLLKGILGGVKDAVFEVMQSIAKMLIQKGVEKLLGGILGGAGGGGGAIGSAIGNAILGNKANGGTIGTYASGGTIGCYSEGGSIMSGIDKAMTKERSMSRGRKAIPIVAHEGEEVLSTLNNDAQFFRKLKKTGAWESLKDGKGVGGNYYNGGTVGGSASDPFVSLGGRGRGSDGGSYNSYSTNFRIETQNVNEFYRSKSQIASKTNQFLDESSRRNG